MQQVKAKQTGLAVEAAPSAAQSSRVSENGHHAPSDRQDEGSTTVKEPNSQASAGTAAGTEDGRGPEEHLPSSPTSQLEGEAACCNGHAEGQSESQSAMSGGHSESDTQCDRCGKWGHAASRCTEEFCDRCQQKGHSIRQCKVRQQHSADLDVPGTTEQQSTLATECQKCKKSGHLPAECPVPESSLTGVFASGVLLTEVIADKGRPVVIRFSDRSVHHLPISMDITDAVQKLAALDPGMSCEQTPFTPLQHCSGSSLCAWCHWSSAGLCCLIKLSFMALACYLELIATVLSGLAGQLMPRRPVTRTAVVQHQV